MDTDTPARGKADIMVLCGHLIGHEQHGGSAEEQISLTASRLQGQRAHRREWITFDAL